MLFVAGRHVVGNEGHVDIGLSDKESLHALPVVGSRVITPRLALVPQVYPLKIFARPPT
jgi:hypothetical protein